MLGSVTNFFISIVVHMIPTKIYGEYPIAYKRKSIQSETRLQICSASHYRRNIEYYNVKSNGLLMVIFIPLFCKRMDCLFVIKISLK